MKQWLLGTVGVVGLVAAGAFAGCDKADTALDCNQICDKYKDCLGGDNYDESACRTRCRDKASDDDFNRRVDQCAGCISDDKSCAQNTFTCAAECAGVVP